MINTERIVPIQRMDLISMYQLILNMAEVGATALQPVRIAEFELPDTGVYIASEPVKTVEVSVDGGVLAFVPAYDYVGFTHEGVLVEPAEGSVEVVPDGKTLYVAEISSGSLTIAEAALPHGD